MALRAGLLNRRVRILARFVETDSHRQPVEQWQEIAAVWARVEPLGGREAFGQQQYVATGDVRFTIRYRADLTPLNRLRFEGRDYDVVTVSPDGLEALLVVARARAEDRPS